MLNEKAKIKPIGGDIEVETVFDEKKRPLSLSTSRLE
ncbi:hypothetical protein [Picosynechococcus sp. PCC 7002]|nr:hypothetical protein [Picosynechococcus sp. PCC 7002]